MAAAAKGTPGNHPDSNPPDNRQRPAHVQRDDTSPFYQVGEAVTVTLDPSDPHVATVGGSDNLAPEVVWPLVALLVLGGGAVFFGLVMLIVIRLARRKARRSIVQADHPA
jgi:Protein of unknown function (DUF3592)